MPTYILLSTLTPEGRHTLHKNPERITGVNQGDPGLWLQGHQPIRDPRRV